MVRISLCIFTDENSSSLETCLDCVKGIAEETIIVATEASEKLIEIASKYSAEIFTGEGIDDVAEAGNLSFEKASMDYILWLDDSDVISEDDKRKLLILKRDMDVSVDTVTMPYRMVLNEDCMEAVRLRRVRLIKNSGFRKWHKGIYWHLNASGKVIDTDIEITGKAPGGNLNRNLLFLENSIELGEDLTPWDLYDYASVCMEMQRYDDAVAYFGRFLENTKGSVEDKLFACHKLAEIYSRLGDKDKEIDSIVRSFRYGVPRAEFCCRLGGIYLDGQEYAKAAFWYETASQLNKPENPYDYYNDACWTWLPHIQLCVCYFHLGKYEESFEHNEIALKYKPGDDRMLFNKEFMEGFIKQHGSGKSNVAVTGRQRLKIVQVSPNFITVPPKNYGGIERVVYDLTEELVKSGHEVYLYAPHGSRTSAHLIPYQSKSPDITDFVLQTLPSGVDLIHDHTHPSFMGIKNPDIPTVCTIHDTRLNPVKYPVYLSRRALQVIGGNRGFYVYNGIDIREYEYCWKKEEYLLFMGELRWHKGILHALDIAEKTGKKLVIAGPVFYWDYFENEIKPRMKKNPNVQYVGAVGGKERQQLFKKAECMVFPTSWDEPFGLVMIEAMACGTPVVALSNGAVPEVMKGFPELACHSADDMVKKVIEKKFPDSIELRGYVERNFSARSMADKYIELYRKILECEE
ncbi:MAG: glycosyltransferase [Clostridia bacterium]|nr:glycosyltransferase [Clostridia bacterium]